MRPASLFGIVLAIAIAFAPLAAAQSPGIAESRVILKAAPPEEAVEAGRVVQVKVGIEYARSIAGQSLDATTVHLKVLDAPAHVRAVISPSTVSISIEPSLATESRGYASALLTVVVAEDAATDAALIRLGAFAESNGPIRASETVEDVLLLVKRSVEEPAEDVCVTAHGTDDAGEVTTQSSSVAMVPALPFAGLAVAGAIVGLFVAARRLRG